MATGPTSSRLPQSPRLDRRSETLFADALRQLTPPHRPASADVDPDARGMEPARRMRSCIPTVRI
jgi:hypothetical protein